MSTVQGAQSAAKCAASQAVLVVCDLQQGLGDAMPGKVLNRVLLNASLLARSAGLLEVPVLHTEQYPAGLGSTHSTVAQALPRTTRSFTKTAFSCCDGADFSGALDTLGRRQVVLVGMEAHICVLQTAFRSARARPASIRGGRRHLFATPGKLSERAGSAAPGGGTGGECGVGGVRVAGRCQPSSFQGDSNPAALAACRT